MIRSVSRTPRRQARNNSRRRRTSNPSLDRSVIGNPQWNAKSPDAAGRGYIECEAANVSGRCRDFDASARAQPLFAALSALPGIGPKLEKLYARLLGREDEPPRMIDLLFHLPTGFVDRRKQPKLADVVPETVVTVAVTVDRHRPPPSNRPRAPYNIDTRDDTNTLTITYFNARRTICRSSFPKARPATSRASPRSMTAICRWCIPTAWCDAANFAKLPLIDPVYPLTEGLHPDQLRKAIDLALTRFPDLPEWQDAAWLTRNGFPSFAERLRASIARPTPADLVPTSAAWSRLAYDELLGEPARARATARHMRTRAGRGSAGEGLLRQRIIAALPYALTASQQRASPTSSPIWRKKTACCGSSMATSAPARRWSRCSPPRP